MYASLLRPLAHDTRMSIHFVFGICYAVGNGLYLRMLCASKGNPNAFLRAFVARDRHLTPYNLAPCYLAERWLDTTNGGLHLFDSVFTRLAESSYGLGVWQI